MFLRWQRLATPPGGSRVWHMFACCHLRLSELQFAPKVNAAVEGLLSGVEVGIRPLATNLDPNRRFGGVMAQRWAYYCYYVAQCLIFEIVTDTCIPEPK